MLTVDETRLDDPAEWLYLAKVALELDAEATGRLIKIEDETGNVLIKDPTLLNAVSPTQSKVFDMSSDSPVFEVFQDKQGFLLRSRLDKEEKTGHSARLTEAEWA